MLDASARLVGVLAPVTLALALTPAAGSTPAAAAPAASATAVAPDADGLDLPRAVRGREALGVLGAELDAAAELNDLRPAELAGLLRDDPGAWLGEQGRVHYREPVVDAPATGPVAEPTYALRRSLALHSNPGSDHTIFLDFDGADTAGSAWNRGFDDMPGRHPAWDPSRNGPSFTDDELARIQEVWSAVAEDYAAFDVDVTTADPGPAAIHRSSRSDRTYGAHAVISPSRAYEAICDGECGGVAWLGVADEVTDPTADGYGDLTPAWVFPQGTGDDPKGIAEAVSHEVGHNLGLDHDGTSRSGYYAGHGPWAPIMGAGYYAPVTQWSRGSYGGADNQEDDVATIGDVLGVRVDEAGADVALAAPLPSGTAYVTDARDVDTYLLGTCAGPVAVAATTLTDHADLDLSLTLLDAAGESVASADPPATRVSSSRASGMSATVDADVPPGAYYVAVDGTGLGSWAGGYDDYGSIGSYSLAVTGCEEPDLPAATLTDLRAEVDGRTTLLTAEVSAVGDEVPVGTVRFSEDGDDLLHASGVAGGTATLTRDDLPPGTHTWVATFVPADPARHATSVSTPVTVTVPRASSRLRLSAPDVVRRGQRAAVRVSVSREDGATAAGPVVLRVGRDRRELILRGGEARTRVLLRTTGRVTLRATWRGDTTTAGSSARRTLRVRPAR